MRSIRAEELCFKGSPEAFKIIDYTYKDKGYSELQPYTFQSNSGISSVRISQSSIYCLLTDSCKILNISPVKDYVKHLPVEFARVLLIPNEQHVQSAQTSSSTLELVRREFKWKLKPYKEIFLIFKFLSNAFLPLFFFAVGTSTTLQNKTHAAVALQSFGSCNTSQLSQMTSISSKSNLVFLRKSQESVFIRTKA